MLQKVVAGGDDARRMLELGLLAVMLVSAGIGLLVVN